MKSLFTLLLFIMSSLSSHRIYGELNLIKFYIISGCPQPRDQAEPIDFMLKKDYLSSASTQ